MSRVKICKSDPVVQQMLTKLRAVELTDLYQTGVQNEFYVSLFKEYLSRSAHFVIFECKVDNVFSLWPFGNLTAYSVDLDECELAYIEQMKREFRNLRRSRTDANLIANAVSWLAVDTDETAFLNPYAPIFQLYLSGGSLTAENGFVNVGLAGIPVTKIERYLNN